MLGEKITAIFQYVTLDVVLTMRNSNTMKTKQKNSLLIAVQ